MGDDIVHLSTENGAFKNKIGSHDEKRLQESKDKLLKQIDDEKKANLIMSRMKEQSGKSLIKWFIYHIINYELDNIVSKRNKLQDLNFNQLKLEVLDTYKEN